MATQLLTAIPEEAYQDFARGTEFENVSYAAYLALISATLQYHGKKVATIKLTPKSLAADADVTVAATFGTKQSAVTSLLNAVSSVQRHLPDADFTNALCKAAERVAGLPNVAERFQVSIATYKESHQTTFHVGILDTLSDDWAGNLYVVHVFTIFEHAKDTAQELADFLCIPVRTE